MLTIKLDDMRNVSFILSEDPIHRPIPIKDSHIFLMLLLFGHCKASGECHDESELEIGMLSTGYK